MAKIKKNKDGVEVKGIGLDVPLTDYDALKNDNVNIHAFIRSCFKHKADEIRKSKK